jgi:membrane fusion protein, copper/silver efflux system
LLTLRSRGGDTSDSLVKASRQRLRLWDMGEAQLDELARRGEPWEEVPIRAPASGFVIEKEVVEGAAVEPGMRVYRIAALDRVWIEAQVFEADLPFVRVGMPVKVALPYVADREFDGKVSFIYPYLQGETRTGQVRIELPNQAGVLKPQMYADVSFQIDRGERLQVPAAAIIFTGPRRLVFVDLGEGRLRPREVQLGLKSNQTYEVVSGLAEGERVVTSGNFLIAAESRLRSAAEYWGGEIGTGDGHAH